MTRLAYSKDDITITPTTSWTDSSNEFDHIVISEFFCKSIIMSDTQVLFESNETRLRDRVIDKISEETGLKYGLDYVFGKSLNNKGTIDFTQLSPNQSLVLRFKGAETFTMFKLKYYG